MVLRTRRRAPALLKPHYICRRRLSLGHPCPLLPPLTTRFVLICDRFLVTYLKTVTNNVHLSISLQATVVDIQPKAHYTLTYIKDPKT